jgi:mannose-6-phosphate isomerase-like protein (cupin superfamily)
VRLIEGGTGQSDNPAYKGITVAHVVFQPGAVFPETPMDSDMVCYIATGEFLIKKADKEFTVKEGEFYTCTKGKTDGATNTSAVVALMEVAILNAA